MSSDGASELQQSPSIDACCVDVPMSESGNALIHDNVCSMTIKAYVSI